MKRTLLAVLALAIIALPALAAGPNVPGSQPQVAPGQHSLTDVPMGGISILYAPSEADDAAFRSAIAAATGGTVDYFDASVGTPDAATLNSYDCVYTWTNFAYADNMLFGDNLADYNDGGGNVVLGAFTTYTSGNFLDGRIMDPGYSPVVGGTNWFISSSYAGDGTTSIYDGVTSFECTFRDILNLQGDGTQDGSYLDGEIAHAYNGAGDVVYSNGSGAVQLGCTGDWAQLVANSCMGVAAGGISLDDIFPAIAGQMNAWQISGATPNDTVTVLCRPQGGGTIVNVGTTTADANGDANVTRMVPGAASGRTLECVAQDNATGDRDTLVKAFS